MNSETYTIIIDKNNEQRECSMASFSGDELTLALEQAIEYLVSKRKDAFDEWQ